ncbi:type II toxin-antitoxin system HicB family antitoxin [Massilia arenae]|nr:type II toxin-antitoxin system HicB family antitoxin [Massilia arenae]
MELPIALHKDENSIYGVTVPDLPGCYSSGHSIDDAIENARAAIYQHCDVLARDGKTVQINASSIQDLLVDEEYASAIWAVVSIDTSKFEGR